jgi:hypothetical protein
MSNLKFAGDVDPTDDELSEGYMLRSVDIFGVPHHCEFIRVEVVDNLQMAWESDTVDPDNADRFGAMQNLYGGFYNTVSLRDCDWVLVVFPYAD